MTENLPARIRKSPGLSIGLIVGLILGIATGSWITWLVIGAGLGFVYDRRKGSRL